MNHRPALQRPPVSRLLDDRRRLAAGREMLQQRKDDLIAAIRQHNATARPKFLQRFSAKSLREYLDHLNEVRQKRINAAQDAPAAPAYRQAS